MSKRTGNTWRTTPKPIKAVLFLLAVALVIYAILVAVTIRGGMR